MSKNWCINGTSLDTSKYSYPIPVIGLYIASGSLICFLSVLYDIFSGFRSRKPWLPCRLFCLNAFTLTVLQVATKLTVDLTTEMPSAQDQLSKLTGTTSLCISMGFLFPSLGLNKADEAFSNLAALTIMVITNVVNICMQIGTGVIFSFIAEHVIIMFAMLNMIQVSWKYNEFIDILGTHKGHLKNNNIDLIAKGHEESLMQRLKLCYLYGYQSNPQFLLLLFDCGLTVMCIICFFILTEALIRFLAFKPPKQFCEGVSDYKWSMWLVVGIQILTVLVVTLAVVFRKFKCLKHVPSIITFTELSHNSYVHLTIRTSLIENFFFYLWGLLFLAASPFHLLAMILGRLLEKICAAIRIGYTDVGIAAQEIKEAFERRGIRVMEWALPRAEEELKRLMEENRKTPVHLIDFLSQRTPSNVPFTRQLQAVIGSNHDFSKISCVSMLMLAKMAFISLSDDSLISLSLSRCLDEVFLVICYIDKIMNSTFDGQWKCKLAEVFHTDKSWFKKKQILGRVKECRRNALEALRTASELDYALVIIDVLPKVEPFYLAKEEAQMISTFIIRSGIFTSIQALEDRMEQMFADMMHLFLSQLPTAIYKDIVGCEVGEYEEKVSSALKFLCQLESAEHKFLWLFPEGSGITKLI